MIIMTTDFEIFEDAFIYDIPPDAVGFFMYVATGRPFYFSDLAGMKRELFKAAQYAECHGARFDPNVVYEKIMDMEMQLPTEKKEKKCGYDAA